MSTPPVTTDAAPEQSAPAAPASARILANKNGPFSRSNIVKTLSTGYLPLLIATLVMILPLLWMLISSFKERGEIIAPTIHWLPSEIYPGNYQVAAQQIPFVRMFVNSVLVTAVASAVKLLLAIFTAYALVFVRFPFKKIIFLLVLIALMVPPQISLLPNYIFIVGIGGKNTFWGLILPGLGTAFGTFLLRQHFLSLPKSILEAAEIDGASHFRRLWRVVAPISAPTIATVALVSIVSEWNEYLWPLVILDKPSMMTLPVGLTLLQNLEPGAAAWGVLMAGAVLVILPILVIFALLQRFIVAGLTQGAVTG